MASENPKFTLFPCLPPEVRLKIWEETWPGPRVFELTTHDRQERVEGPGGDETAHSENVSLHPICSLNTWKWTYSDIFDRGIDEETTIEWCPSPISLQICGESRTHTLKTYTRLPHRSLRERAIFVNPKADVLWLTDDAAETPELLGEVQRNYGIESYGQYFAYTIIGENAWGLEDHILDALRAMGFSRIKLVMDPSGYMKDYLIASLTQNTPEDYAETARRLHNYDQRRLRGLGWIVEYTDCYLRAYGEYREGSPS